MHRNAVNTLCLLLLTLALGVVGLWARSEWVRDVVVLDTADSWQLTLKSAGGALVLRYEPPPFVGTRVAGLQHRSTAWARLCGVEHPEAWTRWLPYIHPLDDEVGIPYWLLASMLTSGPACLAVRRQFAALDPTTCPACGYDLRGSTGACPECGEAAQV